LRYFPVGDDGSAGFPEALLGSAGFPDGFIGLGLLTVLPGALPVVEPGDVFGVVPVIAPEPVVPEGVPTVEAPGAPVPLEPAAPPVWANAMVLERARPPTNAKVKIFMVVSFVSCCKSRTMEGGRVWFRFHAVHAIPRSGTGDCAEMPVLPQGRYAPPAHMLRLTEQRETTPYKWVHPDKDR
jgi:hypothetical protein